ncbi:MAG TPA: glycogen/starch/alpha-glucan phosphorylase [Clostridiaceae bacterium]|nr:glycogen/starch/alpha-glucan phosphorylase [Clostridiaceae bacterium]
MEIKAIKKDICKKLAGMFSTDVEGASSLRRYMAVAGVVNDYCNEDLLATRRLYSKGKVKQVYYFSMEFLIGRLLESNIINLGIRDEFAQALNELGMDLSEIIGMESDPGLGNGGLGRLAACFMDSLASMGIPEHGCGIRYQYGLFEQKIINGYQVELPDNWLKNGFAWETRKVDSAVNVNFGGQVDLQLADGRIKPLYSGSETIKAVPYDISVVGYENKIVNKLRLCSAENVDQEFDFSAFCQGEYSKAFESKSIVSSVSQVLYPDDSNDRGKILRLKQEYFFVSAGLQSIVRDYLKQGLPISEFHEHAAIHINDTHPAFAIPELMRLLMDEHGLAWEAAWDITVKTIAYTNHTIMSEALEKWPVKMFRQVVPRIFMIVHEINERLMYSLFNEYKIPEVRAEDISIIEGGCVHMARLAVVGSHSVNGVAGVHTEILKYDVMNSFYRLYPEKFNNKTNGITHRRWLVKANPRLASAVTEVIGDSWIKKPNDLIKLREYENDAVVQQKLADVKRANKVDFANYVMRKRGIHIDPDSIFDVQAKRLHSYKRQLMNVMNILDLYNRLQDNPGMDIVPRTFIFAAKASPSYYLAKQVIKLINSTAEKINNDKIVDGRLKVVFMENYGVSMAERMIPAADVSEQISTASKEASGTGNMKFMMNGAITLATMDGANVEISEAVGHQNMVIFGMSVQEVLDLNRNCSYSAMDVLKGDTRLQRIVNQLSTGYLNVPGGEFNDIMRHLIPGNDEYYVLKDFAAYVDAQNRIDQLYRDKGNWQRMSLVNTACSGRFSSDNTIAEYAKDIWNVKPVL